MFKGNRRNDNILCGPPRKEGCWHEFKPDKFGGDF